MADTNGNGVDVRSSAESRFANAVERSNYASILRIFMWLFLVCGLVPILAAAFAAWADGGRTMGLRVLGLSLLIAVACAASGWLLGLLFGIPRTLARPADAPNDATSKPNTNLEDVSDWLTKMLVGVGLTQLTGLPAFFDGMAYHANGEGFQWPHSGHLLALGLFFYFIPGGFWLGYFGTRTLITQLFDGVARLLSRGQMAKAAEVKITETGVASADPALKQVDATLLATPLKALTTATEIRGWAGAAARAKDFVGARAALQTVLVDDPGNADAKRQLLATSRAEMVGALYIGGAAGFDKAIGIGEKLLADPANQNDADLHVWLACAYGQKYWAVLAKDPADPVLLSLRKNVMREIDAAIAADPASKARLYNCWRPVAGSIDNDLAGFADDDADMVRRLNP